ncbi:MAG TPA: transposase [Methylocella sp.]|nr:transposase [Methylocella sp.]
MLLVLDGAPNHRCGDLTLPGNISLLFLPSYSPELNPKENLWEEIREKSFKNYALKSIDAVRTKLKRAIFCIKRNPETVNQSPHSPTSESHSDGEMVMRHYETCASPPLKAAKLGLWIHGGLAHAVRCKRSDDRSYD